MELSPKQRRVLYGVTQKNLRKTKIKEELISELVDGRRLSKRDSSRLNSEGTSSFAREATRTKLPTAVSIQQDKITEDSMEDHENSARINTEILIS